MAQESRISWGSSHFCESLRQGHLVDYTDRAGGAEKILHFGSKVTEEIELEISFRDGINGYHVALSPTAEDRFYVHDERCWFWEKGQYPHPYFESLAGSGKEAGISEPQGKGPSPGRLGAISTGQLASITTFTIPATPQR